MTRPRPKFCVGEVVAIDSVLRPDLNCRATEVLDCRYHDLVKVRNIPYTGWVYRVAANPKRWCEPALRKLPPVEENSFDRLMDRLKDREPEVAGNVEPD